MNIPPGYVLDGSVEGNRTLYQNEAVYKSVPPGQTASVSTDFAGNPLTRRAIASFTKKATGRQMERIAWLDFDARNAESDESRLRYLSELAREFRGEPIVAEDAA